MASSESAEQREVREDADRQVARMNVEAVIQKLADYEHRIMEQETLVRRLETEVAALRVEVKERKQEDLMAQIASMGSGPTSG